MKFACAQFYVVKVKWSHTPKTVPPIVEAITGQVAGEACDHEYDHAMPHERFSRDDIDNHEVQVGYRSHIVWPVSRWYFPVADAPLYSWKGLLRLKVEGARVDPYFVGYATLLEQAVTFVATGDEQDLFIPWLPARLPGAPA